MRLYPEAEELLLADGNGYDSPTVLYRYFSTGGALLYVGIAADFLARDKQHCKSAWRLGADLVRLELYPTRELAEIAEAHAIDFEQPLHNAKWPSAREPECVRHNWYLYRMGGLRGEFPRWLSLGHKMADRNCPKWWTDARMFSLPYKGTPATLPKPVVSGAGDADEARSAFDAVDFRR